MEGKILNLWVWWSEELSAPIEELRFFSCAAGLY